MFVNVGDDVKPGKVVCIIEAMKLFNEIESEISGKIVKILVDNATPVEYDQPLFLVEPA
jgi:acetyl-CoA carboxylase biotin carboxyl carrier protein